MLRSDASSRGYVHSSMTNAGSSFQAVSLHVLPVCACSVAMSSWSIMIVIRDASCAKSEKNGSALIPVSFGCRGFSSSMAGRCESRITFLMGDLRYGSNMSRSSSFEYLGFPSARTRHEAFKRGGQIASISLRYLVTLALLLLVSSASADAE